MPVTITVSQVRQALYLAGGTQSAAGDGTPSTALLGKWFHEGLGKLVGSGQDDSPLRMLSELEAKPEVWHEFLTQTAYTRFVGPRLTHSQAGLQTSGPQVRAFWDAMQAACKWLAELSWELRPKRASQRGQQPPVWETLSDIMTTEEPLRCLFREPGWSDSVELIGIADAVVRMKQTGAWCALEFKLGQTSPIVDLGQACLYHLLLSAGLSETSNPAAQSLAVVSFTPSRHEVLFDAEELTEARSRLIELVGKLAGVTGKTARQTDPFEPSEKQSVTRPAPLLLDTKPSAAHLEMGEELLKTFQEYGIPITIGNPVIAGPTFLRFPIQLGKKARVAAVKKLMPEVQVRLQLRAEPFAQLDNGQLVIDVQRLDRQLIEFDQIRDQLVRSSDAGGSSQVPVGIDLSGELQMADLSRPEHAHLLVVGTTGSGKSEWLRFAVAGLLETNTPQTLQLVVIDPKRNAFHALKDSPFLWKPLVFPGDHDAAGILSELADEMDRRYSLFEGADSILQVIHRDGIVLPRIVCVCDEYRDLISRDRPQRLAIEQQICRLGAKARAAGIHLIIATQEARRETIKGALDSNMPARIGFKMGRALESRLLFDEAGAERLLGHGDLLFKDIGDPRRLQSPLLSEANRKELFGTH